MFGLHAKPGALPIDVIFIIVAVTLFGLTASGALTKELLVNLRIGEAARFYHEELEPKGEIPFLAYFSNSRDRKSRGMDYVGRDDERHVWSNRARRSDQDERFSRCRVGGERGAEADRGEGRHHYLAADPLIIRHA